MAYIWRLSAIWLGKEATHGTPVAAQVRIPKTSGLLNPNLEVATDDSGYGVIDEVYDTFTTKASSSISLEGIVRDDFIWYLLLWALWDYEKCYLYTGTASGGTPKRWEWSSTNKIRKILTIGSTTYYVINGNGLSTLTNGTWTLTLTQVSWATAHYFSRLNSNQHPSFTIRDVDDVAASYAPYCMENTFELSCEVGDYVKFSSEFQGKAMVADTSSPAPAYSDEWAFTAAMAGVRFANNEAWLNSASEVCMQNFRISISKNLTDIQCFGSTDIAGIYNQQFGVEWDFEALYSDTTIRDYVLNSDKLAVRFYAINTNATALATGIYPSIYVDLMKAGLTEWSKSDSANEIVKQTLWFSGQYSNEDWATIEIVLINWNSVGY